MSNVNRLPFNKDDVLETQYFSDYYDFKQFLGAGSFGVVVEATDVNTKEQVAVKIVDKRSSNELHSMINEADTLRELIGCPNIIQFRHVSIN